MPKGIAEMLPVRTGTRIFRVGGNFFVDPVGNTNFSLLARWNESWWEYSTEQMTPLSPELIEQFVKDGRFETAD